jgi:hypothetical protein
MARAWWLRAARTVAGGTRRAGAADALRTWEVVGVSDVGVAADK